MPRDHAAIADQHHALDPEALLELADLAGQRRGVADIAFEHFDRNRTALGRAQQPEHDLQLAPLAIAAVAQLRQRTGAALEIGRGDIIENQHAVPQVAPRQRLLDAPLFSSQPVERLVKLLLVDRAKLKHLAQRAGRRLVIETTRRRQLGGRINEPRHDHGDAQRHLSVRLPAALRQDAIEPELAQHAQCRRHVPVRQAAQQRQRLLIRRRHSLVAQHPA